MMQRLRRHSMVCMPKSLGVDRIGFCRLHGVMLSAQFSRHIAGRALRAGIDLLLPARCLACDAAVDELGRLCASCWDGTRFLGQPQCQCCGRPFELAAEAGVTCGNCLRRAPRYDRARAALLYEGVGRDLILGFKLADRTWLAPTLGRWMAKAGKDLLTDADFIVPVPLHRRRLYVRRYNQSVLLARVIGKECGLPVIPDLLIRTRATKPQTRLSGAERRRNVRGAFRVRRRYHARIENRRLLLIDDVLTTGATVAACTLAITRAGGGGVDVLTLARTTDPATSSI